MNNTAQEAIRAKCFHPSGAFVEFQKEEVEQSIPSRFEQQVRKYPDRIAVKSRRGALTYDALNKAANRVAHALLAHGEGKEPVALLMEHDWPVIAAILGALKAGKLYVPLDPSLPRARSSFILEDVQAKYVITNTRNLSLAKSMVQAPVHLLNIDELDTLPDTKPSIPAQPDDLCWVIYTSGSTGKPKGVMQNHRNVLHFMMNYTNGLHICPDDRLTLLYSFSVNGGAHDIFAALLNGAGLFPLDLRDEGFAHLNEWLNTENITLYHSVPTVFRQFAENLTGREKFRSIRIVRLGGEPVYKRDVNLFQRHFSKDCILVNRLGSSETGSLRMYFLDQETKIEGNLVPVGYPVIDNEILLLDDSGRQVAGDEGEIAVRTRYVSPGYWRRPDLTDASFLADPAGGEQRIYRTGDLGRILADGCLLHLGRKDFFVKIRGYRVEIDEVETALLEFPGIKEAAVIALNNNSGNERLVAYTVPSTRPGPNVSEMRRFLRQKLPNYMIPTAFVTLDALPLTDTLKVDRKALPEPNTIRPELATSYVAPGTAVEEELADIWAEVLSLDQVGIYDDFFELGGHSLAATRVVSRVLKQFQLEIPLQCLFQAPTVAETAQVIGKSQATRLSEDDLSRMIGKLECLSDEEAEQLLSDPSKLPRTKALK